MDVLPDEENEKLINLVSQHPPLYDCKHKSYKDQVLKENIWKEIGRELGQNSESCKKLWKNLRDGYVGFKRKSKFPTGSAAPKNSRTKWKTYRLMSFLDTMAQERPGVSNIEGSNIDDYDECTANTTSELNIAEINNIQQGNFPICSQIEAKTDGSPPREEASQQMRKKCRGVSKSQDNVLEYLQKRDDSRQSILKNMGNMEDELGSFSSHIRDVLKKLAPLLQIKANQELFQVLTKYEMMALEPSLSPNDSVPTPSVSRSGADTSSHSREFDIYSPISTSDSTDFTRQTNTVSESADVFPIIQIDSLVNNYPNCSGDNIK